MPSRSVADVAGPWIEVDFDSGLIERCKRFWAVPVQELPDEMLATYLDQRIATPLVVEEGLRRLSAGKLDGSELFEGQLRGAVGKALVYDDVPWPFDQPKNCATISMRQVLEENEPILLVSHDADDHGWQFLGETDANVSDGRVVCLADMVKLDPTVVEVADLEPGWQAVREGVGKPWVRRVQPDWDEH